MASKYRKKFSLPEEFYPVLENYAREVLRDQPVDIIEYSYLYFKAIEEGTIDEFDYPKKGKNIPPSKFERPASEEHQGDQEYGDEGQSYYDENGEKIEVPGQEGDQQQYGEEQEEYEGEEVKEYGEENQNYGDEQEEYDQEGQQEGTPEDQY